MRRDIAAAAKAVLGKKLFGVVRGSLGEVTSPEGFEDALRQVFNDAVKYHATQALAAEARSRLQASDRDWASIQKRQPIDPLEHRLIACKREWVQRSRSEIRRRPGVQPSYTKAAHTHLAPFMDRSNRRDLFRALDDYLHAWAQAVMPAVDFAHPAVTFRQDRD
jgi:hypothetical protein